MADRKITDLTALTTPASNDVLPIVDVSEAAAVDKNKKITVEELLRGAPNGTAAAPSFAFESDGGNGLYLAGTDTVGISTNGTGRLFVDASGNVGVGAANANSSFSVQSTDNTAYSGTARNYQFVNIFNPSTTAGAHVGMELTVNGTGNASSANISAIDSGSGSADLAFGLRQSNVFGEKLRITSDGKVGIGTTSPFDTLHVGGTGDTGIRLGTQGSTGRARIFIDSGNDYGLRVDTQSVSNALFIDRTTGNVGIGTTSPGDFNSSASNLVVSGTGNVGITIDGTSSTQSNIYFADGPTGNEAYRGYISYDHSTDAMRFGSAASTALTIDSSQRILVGTSSARSNVELYNTNRTPTLQVETATATNDNGIALINNNGSGWEPFLTLGTSGGSSIGSNTLVGNNTAVGSIAFSGNDGDQFVELARITGFVDGTPGADDMPGRLVFSTCPDSSATPVERMRITNAGILYSLPTYNNTTSDSANVFVSASGQLYRSTSSIKYKIDVEELQDSYADAILSVRPVWYRSLTSDANPDFSYWGFIAEEVAAIDPRLVHWKTVEVTYDEKGSAVETPCDPEPEGVAYDRFVPHLLNLIKRQKEQIEAMEARLSALETA